MNETIKVIFGLIGGLALFLYGMNNMSDALQKAAGERMKKILGFLTKNPLMGVLAGALVTAVLQSSSATTVMVIGFVSAGLMSLPQAISVIFGANIGTTMTAQLMAFKISNYIYPIIFIGFMLCFVGKKEKVKNVGMVIFSFGLLFEGIEIMGGVMKPLAGSPIFTDLMGKVTQIPVLGVLLGMVMTLVVQSSSATIAVLQNFASQAGADGIHSAIGLAGAIPILLGDNIGTTITAILASIGQSKNAKRTAVAHSVFNISGSLLFLFLIRPLAAFVQWISPKGPELEVISRQIANAHTTFNICCTLIWLPLIPVMVKIVTFLVRGKKEEVVSHLEPKYLDERVLAQPMAAMYLLSQEISRLAEYAADMISYAQEALVGKEPVAAQQNYVTAHETVKSLQEHISNYITRLFSGGGLTESQSEQTAGLLFVTNNLDRVADRCEEINVVTVSLRENGRKLSKDAKEELRRCFKIAKNLFSASMEAVTLGDEQIAEKVTKEKNRMRKAQKNCNKAHLSRVKSKSCDADMTANYSDILYNLDRMADNCVGIAEEAMDHVTLVRLEDLEETDREQLEAEIGEKE